MARGRFTLHMAEVETGIVLNAHGERWATGDPPYRLAHDSREAALAAKDDILKKFPFAEVWLTDSEGGEPERFLDEEAFNRYFSAMQTWRTWCHSSWLRRLLTPEPINPRAPVK